MPEQRGSDAPSPGDERPRALHAPWREEYFRAEASLPPRGEGADASSFLRRAWLAPADDEGNLVVARTAQGLIMLNRYPYAGGHLLAALGEARPRLLDYAPEQRAELWKLVELAAALMDRTLHPQGINYGI